MQGFLLGMANGTVCLAYCSPVLIPFFLGEGNGVRRNFILIGQFLAGRLIGYLLFAVLAWGLGSWILGKGANRELMLGIVNLFLAVLLIFYGLGKSKPDCAAHWMMKIIPARLISSPITFSVLLGFLTGLNLCPPFLAALGGALGMESLSSSLLLFATFFLGTTLFFLPVPLVGRIRHHTAIQIIGKQAALGVAFYYLYSGILTLGGGLIIR